MKWRFVAAGVLSLLLIASLARAALFLHGSYNPQAPGVPVPTQIAPATCPNVFDNTAANTPVCQLTITTSDGSAFTGTVNCIASALFTIPGCTAGTPSITGVGVSPTAFTVPGSFSGTLAATCTVNPCPGTPSYSLVANAAACPTNNNSSFNAITGTTLSTPSISGAGTYVACVAVATTGVTNTGATYPVSVTGSAVSSSPSIIGLTATPAAFLASTGTVDAQLGAQCLGTCPGTPSFALQSAVSGYCSSNNNGQFTLTSGGHLTGSGLGTTNFPCVAITMSGAANSGVIFGTLIPGVASPTINLVSLRQPYFSSGTAFSSPLDIACQPPASAGTTNDLSQCTGVPVYTIDATAPNGSCSHANTTGAAISGASLTLPTQTAVGDYYACVHAAMTGATAASWELKATISAGETVTPAISGIYLSPPYYATNNSYSGTLVTYCVNNAIQSSVGAFAMHCPSAPTYSFTSSCGGNNNGNFTLSGANNQIITSNGSLTTGNVFPCIAATMSGVVGSGTGEYAILYPNSAPTLLGINVWPAFFSTTKGSMTGALRPKCSNSACTGTPSYAFSTSCSSNNNSIFTLNGSALTITTPTPGTYNACLTLTMTGATNSGAAFQVPVVATSSTSNCPATPPPQAVDAGLTQLAYCLDPSQPLYANVFNWANCTRGILASTSNQFWAFDGLGHDCGVSEGYPEVTQVVDPSTGKTVLDFHYDGKVDTDQMFGNFFTLHECDSAALCATSADYPQATYAEYRIRMIPDHVSSYTSQCCAPDFWTFATMSNAYRSANPSLPPGCVQSDPTNYCYNEIPEVDILESGNGIGLLDAVHQYAIPATAPSGPPTCCMSGQGFFAAGDLGTLEMWNAQNLPGVPFQGYTSWGMRFLTDGVASTQYCYYWDNVLVQSLSASGTPRFAPACQVVNFTGLTNSLAYQLRGRHQFNLWLAGGWAYDSYVCQQYSSACVNNGQQGPESQDTYLEYLAIWTCPSANAYNQGNGFDSQPPCPVSQPFPY